MKDRANFVKEHFEEADKYLSNNYVISIRKDVTADFISGESFASILDIACGNAEISKQFLNGHNQLTLIDVSEQMINKAKENIPAHLHSSVSFICGNIDTLDLPPLSFDLVICTGLLAHVNCPSETLLKVTKILKSGGILLLQNTSSTHPFSWAINLRERIKFMVGYTNYLHNRLSHRKLKIIFIQQGLFIKTYYRSIVSFFVFGSFFHAETKYKFIKKVFGSYNDKRCQFLGNDYIYYLVKKIS